MTDETDEMPGSSPAAGFEEKCVSYVRTKKGLILFAEIVLGLIILICFATSWSGCIAVPIVQLILAFLFLGAFMTGLDKKKFTVRRWVEGDVVRAAIGTVLYLVSSVFVVARGYGSTVGAAFGLISVILYAYDTYTTLLQLRSVKQQRYNYNFNSVLPS